MSSPWNDPAVLRLVAAALDEDGVTADVSSRAVVPEARRALARVVAREEGVVAGLGLLEEETPLREFLGATELRLHARDGDRIAPNEVVAELRGPARRLLGAERTLLNFLQRLCGIATMTSRFVAAVGDGRTRIQDTRKTCPGWRRLDKEAVRLGGGLNHRTGLHDMVLLKENHLACVDPDPVRAVGLAVARARAAVPEDMAVEIEVETLEQFRAALEAAPDIVMLDDFDDAQVAVAVEERDARGPTPLIEVSGGVRLERIGRLAALGVDRVSVGALTHSPPALDLALDLELLPEEAGA